MASGGAVARLLNDEDPTRAEARRLLAERGPETYIGDILAERDGALTRWPDREGQPLVVWIQDKSAVPGWMNTYVEDVRDAFQEWDAQVPMNFKFTKDSALADVHVTFIDHFDEEISGRTKWARDEDWWITDANIVLAVNHRDGLMLDDEAMHAMTLHEVGHLIGLDHTKDPTSVMAARVRVRELSKADRATARLLYALPPGPVNK
jgi:predicted Zn-dependent protease